MKAERRHELKSNTLATKLVTLPDTSKKFAGRVVLVCAIVAVAAFLIVNRITTGSRDKLQSAQDLATARQLIDQLRTVEISPTSVQTNSTEAQDLVQRVIDSSTDPKLLAEAYVAKGDLAWALGNTYWRHDGTPMLPGSTSQPSMRPRQDRETLLKDAADAYREVVDRYSSEKLALISAQFGLAALAQNRGAMSHNPNDWLAATELYNTILKNDDAPAAMKAEARYQLNQLPELQKPVLLGTPEKPQKPLTMSPEPPSTAAIGVLAPPPATTKATAIPSIGATPPVVIPATATAPSSSAAKPRATTGTSTNPAR